MRSLRSFVVVVGLSAVGACSQTKSKSSEGQPCSISEDEDPYYSCDEQKRLACIATYDVLVERTMKRELVYLCRIKCEQESDCRIPGDVCCPGTPYPSSGAKQACVPVARCDALRGMRPDGGAPRLDGGTVRNDAAPRTDAPAPGPDAGVDAPPAPDAAPDANADAPADPDAAL